MEKTMKFIFVTGGVVSSLGKGISAACIGRLLKRRGLNVFSMKLDPYLNIDPGTMSPYQHGEVFVTKDGAETDLDLGHYERIINTSLTKESSVTSGKVYSAVLEKERKGVFLGATIQIIPHITNEIKTRLYEAFNAKGDTDVCIVEIGGTVGDIESLPFLEAIRQLRRELGYENTFFVHNTLVPYLKTTGEIKTKPTQHSVKELTGLGIQPDALLLRCEVNIDVESKRKVALFCNLSDEAVISVKDVPIIYEVALNLQKQHLDDLIVKHMHLDCLPTADMSDWVKLIEKIRRLKKSVKIALVGKYVSLHDAYISVVESLKYAGYAIDKAIEIKWVNSDNITDENVEEILHDVQGVIVPGGFGKRGVEGKIRAIRYARENSIPYLGLCLGMQLMCKYSEEGNTDCLGIFDTEVKRFCPERHKDKVPHMGWKMGGTMRLGEYDCALVKGTKTYELYGQDLIRERHRHRYEFNNKYKDLFSDGNLIFSGINPQTNLCEIVELKNHPYFIACQFHPEFLSRPLKAHPLFLGFIKAANQIKLENE